MYLLNALHLKQFYASDLGGRLTEQLQRSVGGFLSQNPDESQLAIGYPLALLDPDAPPPSLLIVMPGEQGAVSWPSAAHNRTIVAHDAELPIPSNSMNRVVLLHALEFSPNVGQLMKEIYRVLVPNGRVVLVVPNRLGLWARSSKSPFGYGRPFSITEMKSLLEDTEFTFRRCRSVMFLPPTDRRWLLKLASLFEFVGQFFLPMCGGIHVVEAEKQLYASIMQPIRHASRRSLIRPASVAVPKDMRD